MGDYKGFGLSLVIGLLAGPLNRAAFDRDHELSDVFKAEVDRHIRDLAGSQRLPGVDEIRVPGQGRVARRREREQMGVPLSATLVTQVDEVARSLGITPLSARA
jgi:LDH2 family malate/lactate/ureidoglycolate dehydrogenase